MARLGLLKESRWLLCGEKTTWEQEWEQETSEEVAGEISPRGSTGPN